MSEIPMITTYRGRRVDQMSRDELIKVIDEAIKEIDRLRVSNTRLARELIR